MKKFILTALAYFISSFVIGYIWHLVFFQEQYDAFRMFGNMANPDFLYICIGTVFESLVFAFLFYKYYDNKSSPHTFGITIGVCLFLFASSYGVFQLAGVEKIEGSGIGGFIGLEFSYMILTGILCGLVGGFVNRK